MGYKWINSSDRQPKFALIAPSFGLDQGTLRRRIKQLQKLELDFCYPEYDDGSIIVEPNIAGRKDSHILTAQTNATTPETAAAQIIYAITKGINVMPLMGGGGMESVIPLVLDYFKKHPEQKNSKVKFFGYSNATFATILAAHGIITFVSTPYTNILDETRRSEHSTQTESLLKLLQGQEAENSKKTPLTRKLPTHKKTYHYPLNMGVVHSDLAAHIPAPTQTNWSLAIEGYIERINAPTLKAGHAVQLEEFLNKRKNNLPKFLEIGLLTTRLDKLNGYANLEYDENGHIKKSAYNLKLIDQDIDKINLKIDEMLNELLAVSAKFNLPVVRNLSFGHGKNHNVTYGGNCELALTAEKDRGCTI